MSPFWLNWNKFRRSNNYKSAFSLIIMLFVILVFFVVQIGSVSPISKLQKAKLDLNPEIIYSELISSTSNKHTPVFGRPDTSKELEEETLDAKLSRRCGIPGDRTNRLSGQKWPSRNLSFQISKYPSRVKDLGGQEYINAEIGRAFSVWTNVTKLTFTRKLKGDDADIQISFERGEHGVVENAFGGPDAFMAHTHVYFRGGTNEICFSQIHFDDDKDWSKKSIFYVAVHEAGHSLGLDHSHIVGSVMWPAYSRHQHQANFKLHLVDVRAIQNLYREKITIYSSILNLIFMIVIIIAAVLVEHFIIIFFRFFFTHILRIN